MRIKLPDGEERILDNDICLDEKLSECQKLIDEFDEYILDSWQNHNVSYFLNGLANYIIWHKDSTSERDKENGILSNSREKQMSKQRYHGRYRKDTLFTDLNTKEELEIFGEMTNNA